MATTSMDYENANGDRFDDDAARYDRDRSASPRRDDGHDSRRRSMSPNGNDRAPVKSDGGPKDDDGAVNPGSNLFVTGIHPRLEESEVTRLFEKYGEVEKCQIMKDPHTGESRGFGFVKMVTSDMADAALEGLRGEMIEGRTLNIEKARRARPRTPTPGKYFGPPKRDPRGRFDDRRRGGYGGYGGGGGGGGYGRDDSYRGGHRGYRDDRGYDRGYDRSYDRGYGGGRDYREDRGYGRDYREDRGYDRRDRDDSYGRIDRYAGREDRDRYGGAGGRGAPEDRRGPSYDRDRYDRPSDRDSRPRDAASSAAGGYGDAAPRGDAREPYGNLPSFRSPLRYAL
ncbi:Serine/arginine-rich splicing factor SR45a [Madurella mycetomatis]|uniref:Serine/arginine-rich splicing factor SR45a n=1 Tax=Madurella mycetomatis TaxID=100816 RepID=A0A175W3J1_9PEZI|nr:Serine/arginine-rich splicing factor SR45a [Madurella mycetomatis]